MPGTGGADPSPCPVSNHGAVSWSTSAIVVLAQVLPIPRLVLGRGDVVDVVLALTRIGTLVGTRRAYERTDAAYWLSPLADPVAAAAIARGIARRGRQTWRGRSYA